MPARLFPESVAPSANSKMMLDNFGTWMKRHGECPGLPSTWPMAPAGVHQSRVWTAVACRRCDAPATSRPAVKRCLAPVRCAMEYRAGDVLPRTSEYRTIDDRLPGGNGGAPPLCLMHSNMLKAMVIAPKKTLVVSWTMDWATNQVLKVMNGGLGGDGGDS